MSHDLKDLRILRALSIEAAALGIMHPVSLHRIESGRAKPRPGAIRSLAARYRISYQEFWDRWNAGRERYLATGELPPCPRRRRAPTMRVRMAKAEAQRHASMSVDPGAGDTGTDPAVNVAVDPRPASPPEIGAGSALEAPGSTSPSSPSAETA